MLTLNFALTKDDYDNFYTFVAWDSPGKHAKRSLYFLKQLGTIVLFTGIFYYTELFDRNSLFAFIVISLILVTAILAITGVRSSIKNQAKKISNDPENSSIFVNTAVVISAAGIFLRDDLTERKLQWPAFIKKLENKEYYFLFYNSMEAIIIPKRVFKNKEDKLLFDSLLIQFLSFEAELGNLIK